MKIIRKISLPVILALGLGVLSLSSWAAFLTSGKPAPNFLVESGDDRRLSLNMIRGKVIVLFYESRHVIKKNHDLKEELTRLYQAQPAHFKKDIFRLVVIDCSSAFPLTPVWKSKLREHSAKEGFTIYGDWTGRMLKDYHLKAGETNFLIIDQQGIIRYAASGNINHGQIGKIKKLLLALVRAD